LRAGEMLDDRVYREINVRMTHPEARKRGVMKHKKKVRRRQHRRIKALTKEITKCLNRKLWYAALVLILTMPDICAALESSDGETDDDLYYAWYEKWLMNKYPSVSATDLYRLRCGVAHQGKVRHRKINYRIFFAVNSKGGCRKRENNGALILDLHVFAKDMIDAVEQWYEAKNPNVEKHLSGLIQYYPNGLSPYLDEPAIG
jgi:hypothetical protein